MKNTHDDIRTLLPFYAAGTLESDEAAEVEAALKDSEDLRNELRFWERTRNAVLAQNAHAAAGHLSAQHIVDFAEGIVERKEWAIVEHHLQSCEQCADEYRLVRTSLVAPAPVQVSFVGRLFGAVKSLRLAYAIPVLALMVVAVMYFEVEKEELQPVIPRIEEPLAETPLPPHENASLWLTYKPGLRSGVKQEVPTLSVEERHAGIDVFVSIPRNTASGIRYLVKVGSRTIQPVWLRDTLQKYASGSSQDSLAFTLPRALAPPPGDTLILTIHEVLPRHLSALEPEEYTFLVVVKGSGQIQGKLR